MYRADVLNMPIVPIMLIDLLVRIMLIYLLVLVVLAPYALQAVATANNHVGLFRRADDRNASARQQSHTTEQQRLDDEERWLFVGKYRSHAARVRDAVSAYVWCHCG